MKHREGSSFGSCCLAWLNPHFPRPFACLLLLAALLSLAFIPSEGLEVFLSHDGFDWPSSLTAASNCVISSPCKATGSANFQADSGDYDLDIIIIGGVFTATDATLLVGQGARVTITCWTAIPPTNFQLALKPVDPLLPAGDIEIKNCNFQGQTTFSIDTFPYARFASVGMNGPSLSIANTPFVVLSESTFTVTSSSTPVLAWQPGPQLAGSQLSIQGGGGSSIACSASGACVPPIAIRLELATNPVFVSHYDVSVVGKFKAYSSYTIDVAGLSSESVSLTYMVTGAVIEVDVDSTDPIFALPIGSAASHSLKLEKHASVRHTGGAGNESLRLLLPSGTRASLNTDTVTLNRVFIDFTVSYSTLEISESNITNSQVIVGPFVPMALIESTVFVTDYTTVAAPRSSFLILGNTTSISEVSFIDINRPVSVNSTACALAVWPRTLATIHGDLNVSRLCVGDGAVITGQVAINHGLTAITAVSTISGNYQLIQASDVLLWTDSDPRAYWSFYSEAITSYVSFANLTRVQITNIAANETTAKFQMRSLSPFLGGTRFSIGNFLASTPPSSGLLMSSNVNLTSTSGDPISDSGFIINLGTPLGLFWAEDGSNKKDYLFEAATSDSGRRRSLLPSPTDRHRRLLAYSEQTSSPPVTCSNPPSPATGFYCADGKWVSNSTISPGTTNSTTFTVSSPTVIYGNLSMPTLVFEGTGSTIVVSGCAEFPTSITVTLTLDDYEALKTAKKTLADLILSQCNGTTGSTSPINVISKDKRSCEKLSGDLRSQGQTMTASFQLDSSNCNTWWIVLVAVVGGVILIVIILVLIFTLVPAARLCIRPYLQRKEHPVA